MLFGNRRIRMSDARRREIGKYRLGGEQLEDRTLPTTTVPLATTGPNVNPQIATAPFGMDFAGSTTTYDSNNNPVTLTKGGAGWSVSDVGDVNGDGYDDFLIGGPAISTVTSLANSGNSAVYLIFGSRAVGLSAIQDWIGINSSGFLYPAANRVGDLGQLGSTTQTNPITSQSQSLPFSGVTFTLSGTTDPNSSLGASVSSVKIGNTYGLIIGRPRPPAPSTNSTPGTGRVYLVTGNLFSLVGQTVSLDATSPPSGVNITTFVNTISLGGQLGYSVAGGTNIVGDGAGDIIMGDPSATVGVNGAGAVYVISTAAFNTSATQTIDVSGFGQSNNRLVFAGTTSGSQVGWSVADAFSVNGTGIDSLIIGVASQGSGGAAYLVYGAGNLNSFSQTVTTNGTTYHFIPLSNVGVSGGPAGAVFNGPAGSLTGWSVSSGGFFDTASNVTPTHSDIIIGSPGYLEFSNGLATVIYGAQSSAANFLSGSYTLNPGGTTGNASAYYLVGPNQGDQVGYSIAPVGYINTNQPSLVLVGSPGFNGSQGSAYLIAGQTGGITGTQNINQAVGVQFTVSTPSGTAPFFGASVSSRFRTTSFTADGDTIADMIIGAPGYDATQDGTRSLAGGAMIVQGGLVTVPLPNQFPITVNGTSSPFNISATTPANLQIYVYATAGGTFQPVRDLNPAQITVNGVTFANPTLTPDTNQNDWLNGFQDVIVTITPRSSLNLASGNNQTITVVDNPPSTSPLFGQVWTGTATGTVVGGSGGGGGGGGGGGSSSVSLLAGAGTTAAGPAFGPTQYVPTVSQLSAYNYAPIPLSVAMQQYAPSSGFNERLYSYNHNGKHLKNYTTIRGQAATGLYGYGGGGPGPNGYGYNKHGLKIFVNNRILDRSRFSVGKSYTYTHKAPKIGSIYKGVVPVQLTTQHITGVMGVKGRGDRHIGKASTSGSTFNSSKRGGGL